MEFLTLTIDEKVILNFYRELSFDGKYAMRQTAAKLAVQETQIKEEAMMRGLKETAANELNSVNDMKKERSCFLWKKKPFSKK